MGGSARPAPMLKTGLPTPLNNGSVLFVGGESFLILSDMGSTSRNLGDVPPNQDADVQTLWKLFSPSQPPIVLNLDGNR